MEISIVSGTYDTHSKLQLKTKNGNLNRKWHLRHLLNQYTTLWQIYISMSRAASKESDSNEEKLKIEKERFLKMFRLR